jgi:hypothetical protein
LYRLRPLRFCTPYWGLITTSPLLQWPAHADGLYLKRLRVVLLCGSGHLVGSVVLGAIGIGVGIELTRLEWVETLPGILRPGVYAV